MDISPVIEHRRTALVVACQPGLCKDEIQLCQQFLVHPEFFAVRGGLVAQGCKDSLDFLLLLDFQFADLIVQLYNSHGFYEQGGTGRGLVVDHTGHLVFVF